MSSTPQASNSGQADPLIDEVRAIRRSISDRFGNDVDRLCEHLRKVEATHSGPTIRPSEVATVQQAPAAPVSEHTRATEHADPLLDEIRAIREARAADVD